MKTVSEIKQLIHEIDELVKQGRGSGDKPWRNRNGKLRRFYYRVQLYLETKPREQFLMRMKADRERHIEHITSVITHKLMGDLYPKLSYRKAKNQFLKDNGVPDMKDMVKTIDFILN